jgi:hypothetical protein
MLPLLAGKNSGKSHQQQEQSENKACQWPYGTNLFQVARIEGIGCQKLG